MNRVQRRFILDAIDADDKLTEWEHKFISDLAIKDDINPDYELSEKQNEILNRIQRKIE